MVEELKRGRYSFTPYFLIKNSMPVTYYQISDAIMECASIGVKAGNFILQDIEETETSLNKSGLIDLLKKLSRNKTN